MDDWLGCLGSTFQLRKTTEAVHNVHTIWSKLLESYKEGENFHAIACKNCETKRSIYIFRPSLTCWVILDSTKSSEWKAEKLSTVFISLWN